MSAQSTQATRGGEANRLMALDFLRGYFIFVIILDHLWKFPSVWSLFTGEAKLWMTAAEGFVIISGFLIGYVRGYKGLKLPFTVVANKLFRRSALLYVWLVIASIVYAAINWYGEPVIPNVPSPTVPKFDWVALLTSTLTLQAPALWVYFLAYYAVFLFVGIGVIWLLRHNFWLAAITLSVLAYTLGIVADNEYLKWQIMFFLPAVAGFYFERIRAWWSNNTAHQKHVWPAWLYAVSAVLFAASAICVYTPGVEKTAVAQILNAAFDHDYFGPARVLVSMVWFVALAMLFTTIWPFLRRYTFGVLEYFGTHSLTAYICHGLIICAINTVIQPFNLPDNALLLNTLWGAVGVLAVYGFIKLPVVAKIVPR